MGNQEIESGSSSVPLYELASALGGGEIEVRTVQQLNFETLNNIMKKVKQGITIPDVERLLLEKGAREMGGEENIGTSNEYNIEAKLVKTIIDEVEKNKEALAKYHKITLSEKFDFKFFQKKVAFTTSKETGLVSDYNLGQFLGGVVADTVRKWRSELNNLGFALSEEGSHKSENIFRRIRSAALILFKGEGAGIQNGRSLIEKSITSYMNEYLSDIDYITEICLLLDECALWKSERSDFSHSEVSIEEKLSRSDYSSGKGYLQRLRYTSNDESEHDTYSKYLRLAVNLLLIEQSDFNFFDHDSYNKFRDGSLIIIFNEMVDKGIFNNEVEGIDDQFKALAYTLYALTCARYKQYNLKELDNFRQWNNPNALYNFIELSEEIDTKIDLISNFRNIDKFNIEVIESLNKIQFKNFQNLFIDYNIPSFSKISKTLDKLSPDKHYLDRDTLLLIPFYGHYSNDIFNMLEEKVASLNYKYKENAVFMDIMSLGAFFNLNELQLQQLNYLNTLIKISLGTDRFSDFALRKLEKLSDEAIFELQQTEGYLGKKL